MASETKRGVPGVPLGALNAIQDANTRMVLQAIVDGWSVRNGDTGNGDSRFITKGELASASGINYIGGLAGAGVNGSSGTGGKPGYTASQIDKFINDMEAAIMETALWKDLGSRIQLIDRAFIDEQNARIAAVQGLADSLAAEAATRLGFDNVVGSRVNTLESVTNDHASLITGLTTRVGGTESTIIGLQQTTATQATQLSSLTTRTGTAESNITSLQQTTATTATSLNSLSTRVGGTESRVSTLETTTGNQATRLTSLETSTNAAAALITNEQITRLNSDNAIASAINTIWSNMGSNQSLVQSGTSGVTNAVGAVATFWNQLDAAIKNPAYNPSDPNSQKYLQSASILQKAETAVSVTGTVSSQYSVKIDNNGYISGFGLLSTSKVDENPYSDFIIRADRFSVGSPAIPRPITGFNPDGSPIYGDPTPDNIPFMVQTTNETLPDGNIRPAGVYIKQAFIRRADIGTLLIDGEAVTKTRYTQAVTSANLNPGYTIVCVLYVTIPSDAGPSSVVITGTSNGYPTDSTGASFVLGIGTNTGGILGETGVTVEGGGVLNAVSVGTILYPGTHTIYLGARTQSELGAANKYLTMVSNLIVQAAFR